MTESRCYPLALAVLAVLALAGCKLGTDPSGEAGSGLPTLGAQAYIDALDEGGVTYSTEAAAVELGEAVCDVRRGGGTSFDAANMVQTRGYSAYHAGFVVGAAVGALCPEVQ